MLAPASDGPKSCFRGKAEFVKSRSAFFCALLLALDGTSGNAQETNMVFVELPAPQMSDLIRHMGDNGVVIRGSRWVLHLDVDAADVAAVCEAVARF